MGEREREREREIYIYIYATGGKKPRRGWSWRKKTCGGRGEIINMRWGGGRSKGWGEKGEEKQGGEGGSLVTRIAATSKSQVASDCNRNSKKITATPKTPSEAKFFDSGTASFVWFLQCFRSATWVCKPPRIRCDYKGVILNRSDFFGPMRFLWLRHCDFTAIPAKKACDFEVVIANR